VGADATGCWSGSPGTGHHVKQHRADVRPAAAGAGPVTGEPCRPLVAATAAAEGGLLEDEATAVEVGPGADHRHDAETAATGA
jgi:hypothetical protein